MRALIFLFFSLVICVWGSPSLLQAQEIMPSDARKRIMLVEDSLQQVGIQILEAREAADRFRADSLFTRMLVRALKMSHSFYYPFGALTSLSKLYAPDSSFRIFTWQVVRDENLHRRHGAIQMRTKDGSLKLFPLIDRTFMINAQADTITNNQWWIGAIYYKILQHQYNNIDYYTLLGYDENSFRSTIKRIEVLHFDNDGYPVFGGQFSFAQDTVKKRDQSRFWIEYKKNGNARMNYDPDLDIIIYDHLISETNEPTKKFTYIPDGDYEGFKWLKGKWMHIEKVFTFKLEDGQAPAEKPVKEKKLGGNE